MSALRRILTAAIATASVCVLAPAAASAAPSAPVASTADFAGTAMDIIPSGQYGSVPPPAGALTQTQMYNALTPMFNHVTDAQLPQFFKPERRRGRW